jgi:hypothetical protein
LPGRYYNGVETLVDLRWNGYHLSLCKAHRSNQDAYSQRGNHYQADAMKHAIFHE